MRKGSSHSTTQCYNAHVAVDADGSQLILAAHISQCSADTGELLDTLRAIPSTLGQPQTVLADTGYYSASNEVRNAIQREVEPLAHKINLHLEELQKQRMEIDKVQEELVGRC